MSSTNKKTSTSSKGSYMELYKKYRPRTWDEVVGQDAVVKDLRQAVADHRLPTAYLFSGPRGTGKTTDAYILAKAINCEHPNGKGDPCNECATCVSIDNNVCLGFHYISAANNGGVDQVREFMDKARRASNIRKPIWVIDEVHRLSKEAFDSLLIPMEDTSLPSLFIFCTTELSKVPKTVRSRLQNRTFSLVPSDELRALSHRILAQEGYELRKDDEARQIAMEDKDLPWSERRKVYSEGMITRALRMAGVSTDGGSVRETLSTLDQVLSNPLQEFHNYSNKMTGALFARRDAIKAMSILSEAIVKGEDPRNLTQSLVDNARELLAMIALPNADGLDELRAKRWKMAHAMGPKKLMYVFRRLGMAQRDQLTSDDARLYLELALVDIASVLNLDDSANDAKFLTSIMY